MDPSVKTQSKEPGQNRIAKAIADAGYTSRRQAETLINEKRVFVNNKCVTHPSLLVSASDKITINGVLLKVTNEILVWRFYKPRGLITTHSDTHERPTVFEFIKTQYPRMDRTISVGRLDLMSEGLLLLTNSGDFAQYAQSPSTLWVRNYHVRIYGNLTSEMCDQMCKGIMIKDKLYRLHSLTRSPSDKDARSQNQWVKVSLVTGKNREIRELFSAFDIKISRLIRLSYGPFQLGELTPGALEAVPPKTLKPHLPPLLIPRPPRK